MIKYFLLFEIKSFIRSSSVGKSVALKLFLVFIALYLSVSLLGLGVFLYKILETTFPDQNPFQVVQQFIGLWFVVELMLRFFVQTLPVIEIKSFITQNIKKKTIIHYVLIKSVFSFYNLIGLFVAVPFALIAYRKESVSGTEAIAWVLCIMALVLIINYTNFLIKKSFTAHLRKFCFLMSLVAIATGLEHFDVFSSSYYIGQLMLIAVKNPALVLVFFGVAGILYLLNYQFLKGNLYLDSFIKTKESNVETTDLNWIRKFGSIAPFIQLDLKLIWRNKRPRATLIMSVIFLAYGLIFYTNPAYNEMPAFFVFIGIFVTGIFVINFGQFIPSWESNYFSLIHAQNIPLKKYLESKVALLTFSAIVLGLASIPYVYFGWNVLWINLACALYNIGVNVLVILYSGSFNKKKIDLEKSPFMNYQGAGAAQWLVGFPLLLVPILIWYVIYKLTNQEIATIALGAIGILFLFLRNYFIKKIVLGYQKRKYDALQGFKQQEN